MEVKQNEINVYWRAKNQKYNQRNRPDLQVRQVTKEYLKRNRPDLQVRQVTKEYLSKKQKMLDVAPTQDNWENQLLDKLIVEIRGILSKKKE
jgi:hypothetical protein